MSAINPTTLAPSALRDALVACAKGLYPEEAAVQLLVDHRVWLHRTDFVARCVTADDDGWTRDGTATLAAVDWSAALAGDSMLPCSSGERAVLRLAAMLAHGELGELVSRLDQTNLGLFLEAVAHAGGWHEQGIARRVTGLGGAA